MEVEEDASMTILPTSDAISSGSDPTANANESVHESSLFPTKSSSEDPIAEDEDGTQASLGIAEGSHQYVVEVDGWLDVSEAHVYHNSRAREKPRSLDANDGGVTTLTNQFATGVNPPSSTSVNIDTVEDAAEVEGGGSGRSKRSTPTSTRGRGRNAKASSVRAAVDGNSALDSLIEQSDKQTMPPDALFGAAVTQGNWEEECPTCVVHSVPLIALEGPPSTSLDADPACPIPSATTPEAEGHGVAEVELDQDSIRGSETIQLGFLSLGEYFRHSTSLSAKPNASSSATVSRNFSLLRNDGFIALTPVPAGLEDYYSGRNRRRPLDPDFSADDDADDLYDTLYNSGDVNYKPFRKIWPESVHVVARPSDFNQENMESNTSRPIGHSSATGDDADGVGDLSNANNIISTEYSIPTPSFNLVCIDTEDKAFAIMLQKELDAQDKEEREAQALMENPQSSKTTRAPRGGATRLRK